MEHKIVLSYGDDEHMPVLLSIGHNLKEKNIFHCKSKKIIKSGPYEIVRTEMQREDKSIYLIITYTAEGFVRGFLYIEEKEYPILRYSVYSSMQIEKFAYDNMAIVRLPNEFAAGNYF